MIQIIGRRRTGKTSLLLSCLNELKNPSIVLDGRTFSSLYQVRREEFIKLVEISLNQFLSKYQTRVSKIIEALKRVQGVEVSAGASPTISLRWGPRPSDASNIASILDALSNEALKQKTHFIIALDEAQEFRKIMRYDLTSLLAHAYDYCRGLVFVVTGSEIGTLHKFLRVDDAKASLYGRAMVEIDLKGLSREMSIEYLKEGFAQIKLKVPEEMIESTYRRFDGIIGWLTYLGFEARQKKKLERRTIDSVARKASKMVAEEFENFKNLHKSQRYNVIMKTLARGPAMWAELKRAIEIREGVTIGQGEITKLLSNLEDSSFITKDGNAGSYFISDPMVIEAASNGLI
jgi:AAA+ ATPase superfamily predicted ATPase